MMTGTVVDVGRMVDQRGLDRDLMDRASYTPG